MPSAPKGHRGKRDTGKMGQNEGVWQPGDYYRYAGWVTDFTGFEIYHIRVPASEIGPYECFTSDIHNHPEWIDCRISHFWVHSLIEFLDELGMIPKKITPESRQEDLKIIHRLLDLLEKPQQKHTYVMGVDPASSGDK